MKKKLELKRVLPNLIYLLFVYCFISYCVVQGAYQEVVSKGDWVVAVFSSVALAVFSYFVFSQIKKVLKKEFSLQKFKKSPVGTEFRFRLNPLIEKAIKEKEEEIKSQQRQLQYLLSLKTKIKNNDTLSEDESEIAWMILER